MTDTHVKEYIEKNIELIDNGEWKKFFEGAPNGCGAPLYEAGIPFMEELGYIPTVAFDKSTLTHITIPNNVTSIGYAAFRDCYSLKSVTIGSGVESMDSYAFAYCTELTSIDIPNGITSISRDAFYRCTKLTTVTIPNSVTSIGDMAFADCRNLKNITFYGTKAEWNTVDKGGYWNSCTDIDLVIHCTDGDINK